VAIALLVIAPVLLMLLVGDEPRNSEPEEQAEEDGRRDDVRLPA
jgi:hypothetical protein